MISSRRQRQGPNVIARGLIYVTRQTTSALLGNGKRSHATHLCPCAGPLMGPGEGDHTRRRAEDRRISRTEPDRCRRPRWPRTTHAAVGGGRAAADRLLFTDGGSGGGWRTNASGVPHGSSPGAVLLFTYVNSTPKIFIKKLSCRESYKI